MIEERGVDASLAEGVRDVEDAVDGVDGEEDGDLDLLPASLWIAGLCFSFFERDRSESSSSVLSTSDSSPLGYSAHDAWI